MTWRDRLRTILAADQVAHDLIDHAHRESAERYAQLLEPGAEIVEEMDGKVIAPFRHHLVGALRRRGMTVTEIPGGWRIERSPFVLAHETDADGVICRCGQRWFSCGCAAELPLVDPPWAGWPRYLWRVKKEEMQRG